MRRSVAVLLAVGAFFIVLAPLIRFPVASTLVHAPLGQYSITKLTAENAQYFSIGDLKVLTGHLDITVTTRGDAEGAKGDNVVWEQFTAVNDVTNSRQGISLSESRSAFNMYTGEGVNCCGANVDKEPVTLSGQIYLFPFGTEKKTYKVFNSSTKQAYETKFVSEDTIDGLPVYKFVQTVPPTKIQTITAPASVLGMSQPGDVQADRFYDGVVTYWIEPTSGAPVNQEQQRHEVLKTQDGVERTVAFVATAKMTPDTVGNLVKTATDAKNQIGLLKTTLPLILLVVGLLLVVVGVVIVLRRPRREASAA